MFGKRWLYTADSTGLPDMYEKVLSEFHNMEAKRATALKFNHNYL